MEPVSGAGLSARRTVSLFLLLILLATPMMSATGLIGCVDGWQQIPEPME